MEEHVTDHRYAYKIFRCESNIELPAGFLRYNIRNVEEPTEKVGLTEMQGRN